MTIKPATPEHAPLIGRAVVMAIGAEITRNLAGQEHTPADVEALFSSLAARPDTQYSYLNTLPRHRRRRSADGLYCEHTMAPPASSACAAVFFEEALRRLDLDFGTDPDSIDPETTPDEFYLDTLAVFEPAMDAASHAGS